MPYEPPTASPPLSVCEAVQKDQDLEVSAIKQTPAGKKRSVANPKKKNNYNIKEIHNKIINHISNLSLGKKMNLITSKSSGYDSVIQHIQKQKRLELSMALRAMCANQTTENSDFINSIIPDIGIKIEDLPIEVIQELSSTLDVDFDSSNSVTEITDEIRALISTVDVDFPDSKDSSNSNTDLPNFNQDIGQNFDITRTLNQGGPENFDVSGIKTEVVDDARENESNDSQARNFDVSGIKAERVDDTRQYDSNVDAFDLDTSAVDIDFSNVDNSTFFPTNIKKEIVDDEIMTELEKIDENTKQNESQTKKICFKDQSTQTELFNSSISTQCDLIPNKNRTLNKSIESMFKIDQEIDRLTRLRQSLFTNLIEKKKKKKKSTKSPGNNVGTIEMPIITAGLLVSPQKPQQNNDSQCRQQSKNNTQPSSDATTSSDLVSKENSLNETNLNLVSNDVNLLGEKILVIKVQYDQLKKIIIY